MEMREYEARQTAGREFFLPDDGIRIHCKLDFPRGADAAAYAEQLSEKLLSHSEARDSVSYRVEGEAFSGGDEGDAPSEMRKIPLLILFHGFTGNMEETHIRAVAVAAGEAGYACLRAELYGHGGSGGCFRDHTLFKWLSNALAVVDFAAGLPFVSEISLCGHSQGGLLAMLAGAMEQDRIRSILPLSPAWMIPEGARKGELLGTRFDPVQIPEALDAGKGLCLGGNYIRAAQLIEVEPSIRCFRKPVLLVHGSADLSVPMEYSVRAAELYADARLVVVPEDTHCYDLHLDRVVEAVRSFLLSTDC